MAFVRDNKRAWINVNDHFGWKGKPGMEDCVYATPTMVLVDKAKKVIGTPITIDELLKLLPTNQISISIC